MKQRILVFVLVFSVMLACSIDPIFNEREITKIPLSLQPYLNYLLRA